MIRPQLHGVPLSMSFILLLIIFFNYEKKQVGGLIVVIRAFFYYYTFLGHIIYFCFVPSWTLQFLYQFRIVQQSVVLWIFQNRDCSLL